MFDDLFNNLPCPGVFELLGLKIVVAPPRLLEFNTPIKKHKKRRGQTDAYHRRIQKKWTKRWGTRVERSAIFMNPSIIGMRGGPFIAIDPCDAVLLKNFTA